MDWRSDEDIEEVGMKSDRMAWESWGKVRVDQAVCQSGGRVGICVGMYRLHKIRIVLHPPPFRGSSASKLLWVLVC